MTVGPKVSPREGEKGSGEGAIPWLKDAPVTVDEENLGSSENWDNGATDLSEGSGQKPEEGVELTSVIVSKSAAGGNMGGGVTFSAKTEANMHKHGGQQLHVPHLQDINANNDGYVQSRIEKEVKRRGSSFIGQDVVAQHVMDKFKNSDAHRRSSMSAAAKNLKLDLNKWRGTNKPFDMITRGVIMEVLNRFDFDGDGHLEGEEIVKVAEMIKAANEEAPGGGIAIGAFPEKVRECVAGFDLDDSGYVEPIEVSFLF